MTRTIVLVMNDDDDDKGNLCVTGNFLLLAMKSKEYSTKSDRNRYEKFAY